MGKIKEVYNVLFRKPEGEKSFRRLRVDGRIL